MPVIIIIGFPACSKNDSENYLSHEAASMRRVGVPSAFPHAAKWNDFMISRP